MIIEQYHETQRLTALADALESRRVLAGWAEIRAEQIARQQQQMACVRPRYTEESENNG